MKKIMYLVGSGSKGPFEDQMWAHRVSCLVDDIRRLENLRTFVGHRLHSQNEDIESLLLPKRFGNSNSFFALTSGGLVRRFWR